LVQTYLPSQSGYSLRNENNTFHPPFSRTSSFYDSVIPFTIRLLNTLPLTTTESPSLNILKYRLIKFYKTWDTNAFYNFGIRKFIIIRCQLRNDASKLNAHVFNGALEDNDHFLFICPKYNNKIGFIQAIIPKNNNVDINIDLLLHGNISFSNDLNTEILQAVH